MVKTRAGKLYSSRKEYLRAWRKANPRKQRQYDLSYSYKMTPEQLKRIINWKGGQCPICDVPMKQVGTRLNEACVDHDHKTDAFRDMVCGSCNRILGFAKDQIFVLQNAIKYLKEHNAQ